MSVCEHPACDDPQTDMAPSCKAHLFDLPARIRARLAATHRRVAAGHLTALPDYQSALDDATRWWSRGALLSKPWCACPDPVLDPVYELHTFQCATCLRQPEQVPVWEQWWADVASFVKAVA